MVVRDASALTKCGKYARTTIEQVAFRCAATVGGAVHGEVKRGRNPQ